MDSEWRKSSFSHTNGCVEARWVKATASQLNGCVEVAIGDDCIEVRDTDDPSVVVNVRPESWRAFIEGVKAGEFSLPEPTES